MSVWHAPSLQLLRVWHGLGRALPSGPEGEGIGGTRAGGGTGAHGSRPSQRFLATALPPELFWEM